MNRKGLILLLLSAALLTIVILWPQQEELPHLGTIENETLEKVDGGSYSLKDKSIKLVMFFYSSCPDICPMTMFDLEEVKTKLEERNLYNQKVKLISITLDPDMDTTERLREYAGNFGIDHEGWMMLRADTSVTKRIAKDFRMVYQKNESGFVTHSTTMYLVDAENNIRAYHDMAVGDKRVNIKEIVKHIELLSAE
ncbi:SCO family protein [Bacillus sp. AK031]